MIISVSRHTFEKEVLKSPNLVLVNFWVRSNDECKKMRKIMRELDLRTMEACKVVEVDWELENSLKEKYRVFGVPTLLIFDEGRIVSRYSGILQGNEFLQNLHI